MLEEKPSGLLVASLQAKDPDEGENGTIIYSLIGMSSRTGKSMLLCLAADGCPLPRIPTPHFPSFAPSPASLHHPCSSQPCSPVCAGAWAERFTLHVATGELRTATVLRRAERAEYIFTVTASDRGAVPRSTSAIVRVQVPELLLLLRAGSSCPCTIYPSLTSWKIPCSSLAAFSPPPHPLLPSSLGTLRSCSALIQP